MTPFDAVRQHNDKLVQAVQSNLGVSTAIRVFESAEGSLSPLTIADSQAAAKQVREAIQQAASSQGEPAPG